MPDTPTPDEVWRLLTHVVIESRDPWRRAVTDRTGLPFSRIRVLKRLRPGPITLKELAYSAGMDAPAATVAVNDLEERGLVVREIDPRNRRQKLVSITEEGERMLAFAKSVPDPAPPPIAELSGSELRTLRDLLRKLEPED
ncbi:MarR family transcriptional regulator [Nocardia sp. 2]|uniref:MarR family transcriptional regulator n=1 Tax=Nocardia acididurans TaxID=2802282 RepID=A0ABS1M2I0_9NOCA|nr:MarR family transcriptional regulator [Nocardia acididurans]MBL1074526.1 MarR family transcriptional regulator [Nocardia acididurans]